MQDLIKRLAETLIMPQQGPYLALRQTIILEHGYDSFRDIQCKAFDLILKGPNMLDAVSKPNKGAKNA